MNFDTIFLLSTVPIELVLRKIFIDVERRGSHCCDLWPKIIASSRPRNRNFSPDRPSGIGREEGTVLEREFPVVVLVSVEVLGTN